MKDFLHHLFLPRESNNHRPKLLHHKSLIIVIVSFVMFSFFLNSLKKNAPDVLGTSININQEELLNITNKDREKEGLQKLVINDDLSKAAYLKGLDMFQKNYWAHNSPTGDTPWVFFKKAGYDYTYAGENLARGFATSSDVVKAWMESQSHRENMLSPNYQEVGFAVIDGKLLGEDTTLVVEMFGSKTAEVAQVKDVNSSQTKALLSPQKTTLQKPLIASSVKHDSLINSKALSWNLSIVVLLMFIFIFALDMIIIERKKVLRVAGHNLDHIIYFISILFLVLMFTKGTIL